MTNTGLSRYSRRKQHYWGSLREQAYQVTRCLSRKMLGNFQAQREVKRATEGLHVGKICGNKSLAGNMQMVLIDVRTIDTLDLLDSLFGERTQPLAPCTAEVYHARRSN
jgi:hypothetical protein